MILLLGLLLYVYGVLGFHLFGEADPRPLGLARRAAQPLPGPDARGLGRDAGGSLAAARAGPGCLFASFVVVAVFVVINLFIAVVINNLEAATVEERAEHRGEPADAAARIAEVRELLAEVEAALRAPKAHSRGRTAE